MLSLDARAWGPPGAGEKVTCKEKIKKLGGSYEKTVWCVSCDGRAWPSRGGHVNPPGPSPPTRAPHSGAAATLTWG